MRKYSVNVKTNRIFLQSQILTFVLFVHDNLELYHFSIKK